MSLFAPATPHMVFLNAPEVVHRWIAQHPTTEIVHDKFPDEPVKLRLRPGPQPGSYSIASCLAWPYLNLYLTWWLRDISRETGAPIERMVWKVLEIETLGGPAALPAASK